MIKLNLIKVNLKGQKSFKDKNWIKIHEMIKLQLIKTN